MRPKSAVNMGGRKSKVKSFGYCGRKSLMIPGGAISFSPRSLKGKRKSLRIPAEISLDTLEEELGGDKKPTAIQPTTNFTELFHSYVKKITKLK